MVHIYNRILLNHKQEKIGSFVETWMDLETVLQNDVSQKENQISYINVYLWNLEKWYR